MPQELGRGAHLPRGFDLILPVVSFSQHLKAGCGRGFGETPMLLVLMGTGKIKTEHAQPIRTSSSVLASRSSPGLLVCVRLLHPWLLLSRAQPQQAFASLQRDPPSKVCLVLQNGWPPYGPKPASGKEAGVLGTPGQKRRGLDSRTRRVMFGREPCPASKQSPARAATGFRFGWKQALVLQPGKSSFSCFNLMR